MRPRNKLPVHELLLLPDDIDTSRWNDSWDSVAVLDQLSPRQLPRLEDSLYDAARRIASFMDSGYGRSDAVFAHKLREVYRGIEKEDKFGVVHITGIKPFIDKYLLTRIGVKDPGLFVDFMARIYYASRNSFHNGLREGLVKNRQRYFRGLPEMDPMTSLTHPMYREHILRHLESLAQRKDS